MSETQPAALPATLPATAPQQLPLLGGGTDFEVVPGWRDEPWHASNGSIGVTVFSSDKNVEPSKLLDGHPALIWKHNCIHKPMGKGARVPFPHRTQTLIMELNGVFVHVVERDGHVAIVVADERLGS